MSSISPITPTAATTPGAAAAAANTTGTSSLTDPNTFLKLLVAELKYQDPMNPTDPNTMLSQSAQFSVVEQLNTLTTQLSAMTTSSEEAAGAALIGRHVVGTTAAGTPVTGTVTGLQTGSGGPLLQVNGQSVPMADITSITSAGAAGATTPAAAAPAADAGAGATAPATDAAASSSSPSTPSSSATPTEPA